MKKILITTFCILAAISVSAQTMLEWDDVAITSVNRETATDLAIPISDISQIEDVDGKSQSPFSMSLNGTWKFKWASNPSSAPQGFQN